MSRDKAADQLHRYSQAKQVKQVTQAKQVKQAKQVRTCKILYLVMVGYRRVG